MNNFELTICSDSGDEVSLDFDSTEDAMAWVAGPECVDELEVVTIEALTDDGRRVVLAMRRGEMGVAVRIFDLRRDLAA